MNYPKLSKAFIEGLKTKHNLTYDEVKTWIFCGGHADSSRCAQTPSEFTAYENYFRLCFPNTPFPAIVNTCVCEQSLMHNCYIRKDINSPIGEILIIGSCCIKRFIDSGKVRKCEKCAADHNNRSNNLCNSCRSQQRSLEKALLKQEQEKQKGTNCPKVNFSIEEKKRLKEIEDMRHIHHRRHYFDIPYNYSQDIKESLFQSKFKWDSTVGAWWGSGNSSQIENILNMIPQYYIEDIEGFKEKKINKIKEYKDKNFIHTIMADKLISFADAVKDAKKEGLKWDSDLKLWYKQY